MILKHIALGLAALSLWSINAAADDIDVEGTWFTPSKKSAVTIRDCGDGTPCGYVSFSNPTSNDPLTHDINNPDPELRDRPILGIEMMWGFKARKKKDGWRKGKIYDPTSGRSYGSSLEITEDDTLKVKGCFGPICRTQIWERAPADLALVDAQVDS